MRLSVLLLCVLALAGLGAAATAASGQRKVKILENVKDTVESASHAFAWDTPKRLTLSRQPQAFNGHPGWKALYGQCFKLTQANYEYSFCPFHNVTQRDVVATWNAYAGVLGVYSHWGLHNDSVTAILYTDGDRCGSRHRSANVTLECGATAKMVNASEPSTCHYLIHFETPMACEDQLTLSHILSEKDNERLVQLDEDLEDEFLTPQGYERRKEKLLKSAGILPADELEDDGEEAAAWDNHPAVAGAGPGGYNSNSNSNTNCRLPLRRDFP
eukprot:m.61691 g.61691  ORF g.61691 m.61691 type:complete len:272 (+) comp13738_c1_seq1:2-817(+)